MSGGSKKKNKKSNSNDKLKKIADALGVTKNKSRAKQLTKRPRGKPIDMQTRLLVATHLLRQQKSYRQISEELGVSLGSITNIKNRLASASSFIWLLRFRLRRWHR
jgi:uncharacterized protein YerC